jgi:hypothetical protein
MANYNMVGFGGTEQKIPQFVEPTFYYPNLQINHQQWEADDNCHSQLATSTTITFFTSHQEPQP